MSKIIKRPQAERDLEESFVFIGEKNLDAALDFLAAAEEAFDLLAQLPHLGSPREFRSTRLRNVRMWHIKGFEDYLIFYRVTAQGIEILRVLHGKRDIESIFSH